MLKSVSCKILPATNGITGCETTLSLFGKGKQSMIKAIQETPDYCNDLSKISLLDIDDSVDDSRKLITRLHAP